MASWGVKLLWQGMIGPKWNLRRNVVCRFHPSCSQYARLAFEKYGLVTGAQLAVSRVKRCRPDNWDSTIDYP